MKTQAGQQRIEQVRTCSFGMNFQRVGHAMVNIIYQMLHVPMPANTWQMLWDVIKGNPNNGTNKLKRPRSRLQENKWRIPCPRGKARALLRTRQKSVQAIVFPGG